MFRENRIILNSKQRNDPGGWNARLQRVPRLTGLKTLQLQYSPEFRWIRKYLSAPLLDAACGAGRWTIFLQSKGFAAHGLDYAAKQVAINQNRYPDMKWSAGDIRDTALESNSFGGITCFGGIEHAIEGPGAALREFYRLLKPGHCCIVTVPADHARRREVSLMGNPQNEGEFYEYHMTPKEIANEAKAAGFEVIHSGPVPRTSVALANPYLYKRFIGTRLFIFARLATLFASASKHAARNVCIARKPA